jgi:hypothetical protein
MEAVSDEGPDESIPMDVDHEEAPQKGKKEETSTRRRSGRHGGRVETDPYLMPGEIYSIYHAAQAQQDAISRSLQTYPHLYHSSPPAAY